MNIIIAGLLAVLAVCTVIVVFCVLNAAEYDDSWEESRKGEQDDRK